MTYAIVHRKDPDVGQCSEIIHLTRVDGPGGSMFVRCSLIAPHGNDHKFEITNAGAYSWGNGSVIVGNGDTLQITYTLTLA